MIDGISDLRLFVAVTKEGGLSAAGRKLGLSPPAVSHRLARIEERLGVRLLHRTTRHIALTSEGREYYDQVVRILADLEEVEAGVSQRNPTPRGTLRLVAPVGFTARHVVPFLPEFQERCPKVRIELDVDDRFVDIVESGHDMAICVGRLANTSLIATKLAENRRVMCASPAYLDRHGRPRVLGDLAGHRFLTMPWDEEWLLRDGARTRALRFEAAFRSNSGDVLLAAALAGMGIAVKSLWDVGGDIRAGGLEIVLPEHLADAEVPISAVYPSRSHVPLKVRAFIDFLKAKYAPIPYWMVRDCGTPLVRLDAAS